MLWFFRFFDGFLSVLFYGDFPQLILNLAAENHIFIWNSQITEKGIEACISVKNFKRLKNLIRKKGLRAHILKKRGLPFILSKNRKRLGFFTGLFLFFALLNILSSFIWIIDVTGNSVVSKQEITDALNKIGICEGLNKNLINPKSHREKLLLELDTLAWASLNIEGCRLTVNITEIKKEDSAHSPSNLKAKTSGIVKKINIVSGNCVVKSGDAVNKGDILVSGIIETADNTSFVASAGEIFAETEHIFTLQKKFKEELSLENGKTKKKYVAEFFTIKLPLYLGKENKKYNSSLDTHQLYLFGQSLPIRLYEKKFFFTEKFLSNYSEEELKEKLAEELKTAIEKQAFNSFKIKSKEFQTNKDGITLKAVITAEENIAYNDLLLFENIQNTKKPK